jgi:hypothetical protein
MMTSESEHAAALLALAKLRKIRNNLHKDKEASD